MGYQQGSNIKIKGLSNLPKPLILLAISDKQLVAPADFDWNQIFQNMQNIYRLKDLMPVTEQPAFFILL